MVSKVLILFGVYAATVVVSLGITDPSVNISTTDVTELSENCTSSDICPSNAFCNITCQCKDGYYPDIEKRCKEKVALYYACNSSNECVENARCVYFFRESLCLCNPGYLVENGICKERVPLNSACNSSYQCVKNAQCVYSNGENICRCNPGYFDENEICKERVPPYHSCTRTSQCVENAFCSSHGVCMCNIGSVNFGQSCIKRKEKAQLGENCYSSEMCPTDAFCNIICQCNNGYYENSLRQCIKKVFPYSHCLADSQCVEKASCNERNICECNFGYMVYKGYCVKPGVYNHEPKLSLIRGLMIVVIALVCVMVLISALVMFKRKMFLQRPQRRPPPRQLSSVVAVTPPQDKPPSYEDVQKTEGQPPTYCQVTGLPCPPLLRSPSHECTLNATTNLNSAGASARLPESEQKGGQSQNSAGELHRTSIPNTSQEDASVILNTGIDNPSFVKDSES